MNEGELTLLMENMELKKRLIEEIQHTVDALSEKMVLTEQFIKKSEKTIIYLQELDIALDALRELRLRLRTSPSNIEIIDNAMQKIIELEKQEVA